MAAIAGTVYGELAPLYEAAASRGIAAPTLNACDFYEVAAMLGLATVKPEPEPDEGAPAGTGRHQRPRRAHDARYPTGDELIRQRILAAQGKAPKPEPRPLDPAEAQTLGLNGR